MSRVVHGSVRDGCSEQFSCGAGGEPTEKNYASNEHPGMEPINQDAAFKTILVNDFTKGALPSTVCNKLYAT